MNITKGTYHWFCWWQLFTLLGVLAFQVRAANTGMGVVSGNVYATHSGRGIVAVFITLDPGRQSTYSQIDGAFIFPHVKSGSFTLYIEAAGIKRQPFPCTVESGSELFFKIGIDAAGVASAVTIQSELPRASIQGTVYRPSPDHAPAVNAIVRISGLSETARTDSAGRYELTNIAAGEYVVTAEVDQCPRISTTVNISPGVARTLDLVSDLRKNTGAVSTESRFGMVFGTITDQTQNNLPLSAAIVSAEGVDLSASTDEGGNFELALPEGTCYQIRIRAGGYADKIIEPVPVLALQATQLSVYYAPAGFEYNVEIVPVTPGRVVLTVIDAQTRAPLANATITQPELAASIVTDSSGCAQIDGLARDILFEATAFAPGYAVSVVEPLWVHSNRTIQKTVALMPLQKSVPSDRVPAAAAVVTSPGAISAPEDTTATQTLDKVTFRSRRARTTESAMLLQRQESLAMIDGIGGAEMSRAAAGNAADAMKRVTGASVVDGKYVYVRGLGERYNVTMLDGAELPSTDPNRRAVPMDIFPTALIDNINTLKTFTPDLPGTFVGGAIDIRTKSFPEKQTFSISAMVGGHSATTFQDGFLTYAGGIFDWLGIDDGTRALPAKFSDTSVHIPRKTEAFWGDRSGALAHTLAEDTRLFSKVMTPTARQSLINQSYSMAYGNRLALFERPLGLLASLTYKYKEESTVSRKNKNDGDTEKDSTMRLVEWFSENKSAASVLWGGLGRVAFEPLENQTLTMDLFYTRNADNHAEISQGVLDDSRGAAGLTYLGSTLRWIERSLASISLNGSHLLPLPGEPTADWRYAHIQSRQYEPDTRYFERDYQYLQDEDGNVIDSTVKSWHINNTIYKYPSRYYRDLVEGSDVLSANMRWAIWTLPVDSAALRSGALLKFKNRTVNERYFEYNMAVPTQGDPAEYYFSDTVLARVDSLNGGSWRVRNYLIDWFDPKKQSTGSHLNAAWYGMAEMTIGRFLVSGGVRYERNELGVASADTTIKNEYGENISRGSLIRNDWLPSIGLTYKILPAMALRSAWSQTIMLPTMREMAPYSTYDLTSNESFVGNAAIKESHATSVDLRWEWYFKSGSLLSLGGYYKHIEAPIELVANANDPNDVSPENAPWAQAMGFELEVRTGLEIVGSPLKDFSVGLNTAFIAASTKLSDEEFNSYAAGTAPDTRAFQNQSPYVINANIAWDNEAQGTTAALYYNLFGPRMIKVLSGPKPDVFEMPVHQLDFTLTKKIGKNISVKTALKNILNMESRKIQIFKGEEFAETVKSGGVSVDMGISLTF